MTPKQIDGRIKNFFNSIRQAYRAKIKRVNTGTDIAKVQVEALAGETGQDYDLMAHFGFTYNPPADSEAIVIALGGQTSHSIIIATENGNYRIKSLKPGEVAVYNQSGASITLKEGRIIDVDCDEYNVKTKSYKVSASTGATFTTPNLTASAMLTAQGQFNGYSGMSVSGGTGATISGNLIHKGGKITSTSVIEDGHKHQDSIGGMTGLPS